MPNTDGDPSGGNVIEEEIVFDAKTGESNMTTETPGETDQEAQSAENQTSQEAENKQPDDQGSKDTIDQDSDQMSAKEMQLHHQALDLVGNVLEWTDKEKARKYLADHPELASIANKSKKYKETYRSLNESPSEEVQEKTEVAKTQTQNETETVIDEDELTSRLMANATEHGLKAERKSQAQLFAGKNGINIDDLDKLFDSAEALRKSSDLSFSKCLEGAKTALQGSLNKQTITSPKGDTVDKAGEKTADKETEVKRIMKEHNVERRQAEAFLNNKKDDTADGWQQIM